MVIRPHDLIEISDLSLLKWNEGKDWAGLSLERTPFVVVRRTERPNHDYIPVGIRGYNRNQREAGFLHQNGIKNIFSPYWLKEQKMWQKLNCERKQMPVIAVMDLVMEIMSDWRWGPTGSSGFEMATGYPALKVTSDLDLVIDAPQEFDFYKAKKLLQKLDTLSIRIDIQVETGNGAFLLRELIEQRTKTVVLRTKSGPKLVRNPWDFTLLSETKLGQ
jgi:phosphoribosyl-dephospho-CoA transferase